MFKRLLHSLFLSQFVFISLIQPGIAGWKGFDNKDEGSLPRVYNQPTLRIEVFKHAESAPFEIKINYLDKQFQQALFKRNILFEENSKKRALISTLDSRFPFSFHLDSKGNVHIKKILSLINMDWSVQGDIHIYKTLTSNGNLRLLGNHIFNHGEVKGHKLHLDGKEGVFNHGGIIKGTHLNFSSQKNIGNIHGQIHGKILFLNTPDKLLNFSKALISINNLYIQANKIQIQESSLVSEKSRIQASSLNLKKGSCLKVIKNLYLQAKEMKLNDSYLVSGNAQFDLVNWHSHRSLVKSTGDLRVKFQNSIDNTRSRITAKKIDFQGGSSLESKISNVSGEIVADEILDTREIYKFNNEDGLVAGRKIGLKAQDIFNMGQRGVIAKDTLKVKARSLVNYYSLFFGEKIDIELPTLERIFSTYDDRQRFFQENIKSGLFFNQHGHIQAWKRLKIAASGHIHNIGGKIISIGHGEIRGDLGITNQKGALIQAGVYSQPKTNIDESYYYDWARLGHFGDLLIQSYGEIKNLDKSSRISAKQDLKITSIDKSFFNEGQVESTALDKNVLITVKEDFENKGTLFGTNSGKVDAKNGTFRGIGGNVFFDNGRLRFEVKDFYNYGFDQDIAKISAQTLDVTSKGNFFNREGAEIKAQNDIYIKSQHFNNTKGRIGGNRLSLKIGDGPNLELREQKKLSTGQTLSVLKSPYLASFQNPQQSSQTSFHQNETSEDETITDPPEPDPEKSDDPENPYSSNEDSKESDEKSPESSSDKQDESQKEDLSGYLINTSGQLVGKEELEISAWGEIHNVSLGILSSPDGQMSIWSDGNVLNQDKGKIHAKEGAFLKTSGIFYNAMESEVSANRGELQGFQIYNEDSSRIIGNKLKFISNDYFRNKGNSEILALDCLNLKGQLFVQKNESSMKLRTGQIHLTRQYILGDQSSLFAEESLDISSPQIHLFNKSLLEGNGEVNLQGDLLSLEQGSSLMAHQDTIDLGFICKIRNIDSKIYGHSGLLTSPELFLENEGYIESGKDLLLRIGHHKPEYLGGDITLWKLESSTNGVIQAKNKVTLDLQDVKDTFPYLYGTFKAPHIHYKYLGESDLSHHLSEVVLECDDLTLELGTVQNSEEKIFSHDTYLKAQKLFNQSTLYSLKSLKLHIKEKIENSYYGSEQNQEKSPLYSQLVGKKDILNLPENVLSLDDLKWLNQPLKKVRSLIGAKENLSIETQELDSRLGGLYSLGDFYLRSPDTFIGTPQVNEKKNWLLPHGEAQKLNHSLNYFPSSQGFLVAQGGLMIDIPSKGKFFNFLGNIQSKKKFTVNGGRFFNFGGKITCNQAHLSCQDFYNLVGSVRDYNSMDDYHYIDYPVTPPASLTVLGKLLVNSGTLRNFGGHIYAQNGADLTGRNVTSRSQPFLYKRVYTKYWEEEVKSSKHFVGINTGSKRSTEIKSKKFAEEKGHHTQHAVISSPQGVSVNVENYLLSAGIMKSPNITLSSAGNIQHGAQENLSLPGIQTSRPNFQHMIEKVLTGGLYLQNQDPNSPFLVENRLDTSWASVDPQLYFSILKEPGIPFSPARAKLAMSPQELTHLVIQTLQDSLGTGYLPHMQNLKEGTQIIYRHVESLPEKEEVPIEKMRLLKSFSASDKALITEKLDEDALEKAGIGFRETSLHGGKALIPVFLGPVSSQQYHPHGTTEGENINFQTKGKFAHTSEISGKDVEIDADELDVKTTTHEEILETRHLDMKSSGNKVMGSKTISERREFHKVKAPNQKASIETQGNLRLMIKKNATFTNASLKVHKDLNAALLGSLDLAPQTSYEVMDCSVEDAGMLSTLKPIFHQTNFFVEGKSRVQANNYKNTASNFIGKGDIFIDVAEDLKQFLIYQRFKSHESYSDKQGVFSRQRTESWAEDNVVQRPLMISYEGDIIQRAGHKIEQKGSSLITLKGNLYQTARNIEHSGDVLEARSYSKSKSSNLIGGKRRKVQTWSNEVEPTYLMVAGDHVLNTPEDFVEEGVKSHIGGDTFHKVGGKSTSKGLKAQNKQVIEESSYSFDFLGSDYFQPQLKNAHRSSHSLPNDPFIRQLSQFLNAKDLADISAEGIYTALEAYKALNDYASSYETHGDIGLLYAFGERIGLTDKDGNFDPRVGITFTKRKTESQQTVIHPTVYVTSGKFERTAQNIDLLDGFDLTAGDEVRFTANKKLRMEAGKNESSLQMSQRTKSVSGRPLSATFGEVSCGKSSYQEEESTYEPVSIKSAKDISLKAEEKITGDGVQVESEENVTLKAPKAKFSSRQNTIHSESDSYNVSAHLAGGSFHIHEGERKKAWAENPTFLIGDTGVKADIKDSTYLKGVLVNAPNGSVTWVSSEMEGEDVHDYDHESSRSFGMQINLASAIPVVPEFGMKNNKREGVTRTTIGKGNIQTDKITGSINREVSKYQEITKSDKKHVRIVIPIAKDWSQVLDQTKNNIQTLRKIFTETAKNAPPRQAQAIHQALEADKELEAEGVSEETREKVLKDPEAAKAVQLAQQILKRESKTPVPDQKPSLNTQYDQAEDLASLLDSQPTVVLQDQEIHVLQAVPVVSKDDTTRESLKKVGTFHTYLTEQAKKYPELTKYLGKAIRAVAESGHVYGYWQAGMTGACMGAGLGPLGAGAGFAGGILTAYGAEKIVETGLHYGIEQSAQWARDQGTSAKESQEFENVIYDSVNLVGNVLAVKGVGKKLKGAKANPSLLPAPEKRLLLTDQRKNVSIDKKFSFDPKIFDKNVKWQAPKGTQQNYTVYQRNDIDWNMVRTKGHPQYTGTTNLEAARKGIAPQMKDGHLVNLHHIGQNGKGPLVEVSTRLHNKNNPQAFKALHNQFQGQTHPIHPVQRGSFNKDRTEYWKWRARNVK